MKKFSLILTVVALVLGMTQCRKPIVEPTTPIVNNGEKQHITFGTGNNGSKVNVNSLSSLTWETGDVLYVYNQDAEGTVGEYLGFITLKGEGGSPNGQFEGDVKVPASEHGYRAFYYFAKELAGTPSEVTAPTITANFSDQTVEGWADFTKIEQNLIMRYRSVVDQSGSYNGSLTPCFSVANVKISGYENNIEVTGLEGNAVTVNEYGVLSTTTVSSAKGNLTSPKITYSSNNDNVVLVVPAVASDKDTKVTFTYNNGANSIDLLIPRESAVQGKKVDDKQFKYNCGTVSDPDYRTVESASTGANPVFTVGEDGSIVINKPEEVKPIPEPKEYVAKIGDTEYPTLVEAVAAVPANNETAVTITMINDDSYNTEKNNVIKITNKKIVLDLAGYTVSCVTDFNGGSNFIYVDFGGELTITDSSTDGKITYKSNHPDLSYGYATETLYNCGGKLTIANGTIENTSGGASYVIENSSNAWSLPVVSYFTMTGGTITGPQCDGAFRVYQCNYTQTSHNYVTISGGKIEDTGIFVDVNSPYSEGQANIETVINVTGGEIHGLVDFKLRHKYQVMNISGGNFIDARFKVRKSSYTGPEPTDPIVNISGGTFTFANGGVFGLNYGCDGTDWGTYKPYSITNGTFSINPTDFVASGYEAVQSGNVWTVQQKQGTQVASQQELNTAIANAQAGETIIITAVADINTLPNIPNNITIKGNVENVVFTHTSDGSVCSIPNGATFDNVGFVFGTTNYHGFQHAGTINMKDCTLNGKFFSYSDMNFNNCTFNQDNEDYHMWCYDGNVTYNSCTFNGKGKFLNVYRESNKPNNVTVTNCTFNSTKKNKAAVNVKETSNDVMLNYNVVISGCTTNENFPEGTDYVAQDALWVIDPVVQVDDRNVSAPSTEITVTLNNVVKYPVSK